jgi:hypothetical protein
VNQFEELEPLSIGEIGLIFPGAYEALCEDMERHKYAVREPRFGLDLQGKLWIYFLYECNPAVSLNQNRMRWSKDKWIWIR